MKTTLKLAVCVAAMATATMAYTAAVHTQAGPGAVGEWRDYGGDKGMTKYLANRPDHQGQRHAAAHRLAPSRGG